MITTHLENHCHYVDYILFIVSIHVTDFFVFFFHSTDWSTWHLPAPLGWHLWFSLVDFLNISKLIIEIHARCFHDFSDPFIYMCIQNLVAELGDYFLYTISHTDANRQKIHAEFIVRNNTMFRILYLPDNGPYCVQLWIADCSGPCWCGKTWKHRSQWPFKIINYILQQIKVGACILTLCGNIVVYLTILGYFLFLDPDEAAAYGGMAWIT